MPMTSKQRIKATVENLIVLKVYQVELHSNRPSGKFVRNKCYPFFWPPCLLRLSLQKECFSKKTAEPKLFTDHCFVFAPSPKGGCPFLYEVFTGSCRRGLGQRTPQDWAKNHPETKIKPKTPENLSSFRKNHHLWGFRGFVCTKMAYLSATPCVFQPDV